MSRKLQVLAVVNVVGWLVAVPLLVVALIGPVIGFSDWPGGLPDRGSPPSGEVRIDEDGRAGGGDGGRGEGDGDGRGRSRPGSGLTRDALDRALARRELDAPPPSDGAAGPSSAPGVPVTLPAPGGGDVQGGPDGPLIDLGEAPPLSPGGPPAPGGGGGDGDGDGDRDGDRGAPGGPGAPAAPPTAGPDVPAPAPGGSAPAGGTETPAGPGGRTRSGTRPDGGSYGELQVAEVPGEVDAGRGDVPTVAPEPPAPAPAGASQDPGPVPAAATPVPEAPAVPAPEPQTPDVPLPPADTPLPEPPAEEPAGLDAVRPPEDGTAPAAEEEEPAGGGD